MPEIFAIVDVDPTTGLILGTRPQQPEKTIVIDIPIVIEKPVFTEDGVMGVIIDPKDRRSLGKLQYVTRVDGDMWTAGGEMPLTNASYAFLKPHSEVQYSMRG